MKKIALPLALAVSMVALSSIPAYADASDRGSERSGGKAAGGKDPVSVPEPSSFVLLAFGLAAVAGMAVTFGRKRPAQSWTHAQNS
jgi:hypothetical protein